MRGSNYPRRNSRGRTYEGGLYAIGRCWHIVRQVLGSDCSASSKLVL